MTGPSLSDGCERSKLREGVRDALAFLTPLARSNEVPSPETMAFFPAIGAALGLLEGTCWDRARRGWPALPAAAVVVTIDAALTGALHLDGLADAADGLLAHVPTKDRLDIMAEPDVGTFGTVALLVSIGARIAACASMEPSPLLLAALLCCSRSVMVLGSRALPYAREEGLARPFLRSAEGPDSASRAAIAGLAGSAVLATVVYGRRGLLGVLTGVGAGAAVLVAARRQLGGFTGDVLGAAGQACETVGLVVAARR